MKPLRINQIKLVGVLLLPVLTGCATAKLWDESKVVECQPAKPAEVRVLRDPESGQLFVEYREMRSIDNATSRRCYAIEVNEKRIENDRKPIFLSPSNEVLSACSVLLPCRDPVSSATEPCVAFNGSDKSFAIWADGQILVQHHLPYYSYRQTGELAKCIALTPVAVVIDSVIAIPVTACVVIFAGGPSILNDYAKEGKTISVGP